MSVYDEYEMTIGIECHVQLATKTKLFSGANNDARDAEPNTRVSPIDFGLPGMLPVLNKNAVRLAVRAAKALNAEVAHTSRFDRKHYFYPDLPKGYQTSQLYEPLILSGYVDAPLDNGDEVRVRIHHAHMEEDAGKLTHYGDHSLVDLNRAGTPLIEIVSEPDIHSAAAARAYATELYRLMTYAGVTHGDLYHGNMRFDVNISVAKKGSQVLGTRAEVKNLNSFRSVERAADYEFKRQVDLLEVGGVVIQETRGWNEEAGITSSQRSKEDAQDYRYMPDADIPPIILTDYMIAEMQADFPKLPHEYRTNWEQLQLDASVTTTILDHQATAVLLDTIVDQYGSQDKIRRIFNWFASVRPADDRLVQIDRSSIDATRLIELSTMVEEQKLSSTGAKEVFLALFDIAFANKTAEEIATEKNLLQVSDEGAIIEIVEAVLADPLSAASISDIKAGKEKAIGYLVGQVMKQSAGKANPAIAQKLIKERI